MGRRLAGVCVLLLMSLPACGERGQERGGDLGSVGTVREGFTIGLLLAGEGGDQSLFTQAVAALCPRCRVAYASAGGDRARQERQIGTMLDDGVRVLVLDAVDPGSAAPWVARAKMAGAKVLAYDRLANGPVDAYVATDPVRVGRAQATALLGAMRTRGPVVLLNGPAGDPYAAAVKRGLHAVLDGRVTVGWERDLARPEDAAREAAAAFRSVPGVGGVCCASDAAADAVAAEMAGARVAGVPLIGQGGEPGALRRVRAGTQTVTVRTDAAAVASAAAKLAVEVAGGRTVYGTATVSNGTTASIPAVLVPPAVVTRATASENAPARGVRAN